MTAITLAYARAYQVICWTRHMLAGPSEEFRLPPAIGRYPHLPNARTATFERSNDFQGWAIYTEGSSGIADGETLAGWCYRTISHGRTDVMFGPVITTEAHLAFAGATAHSNNTAEMPVMIEALSFLEPSCS